MKKITLLVAATLLLSVSAKADFKIFDKPNFSTTINGAEPISFVERGIAFYVFSDGQFDFNTEPSRGEVFYRNGRRNVNGTYGAPGANFSGGLKIEHDNAGRIRRIGNVFINYDYNDRIKRIGSVYMAYNRFALSQVGGLRIIYNRFGQVVDFVGSVKGRWNYGNGNFNNNGNYNNNGNGNFNENSDNSQDGDHSYYRKNNEKEVIEEKNSENDNKNRDGKR